MSEIVDYRPYLENDNKVYVEVLADFDTEGNVRPVSFVWEDGNTYEVDRILDKRPAASQKAGGAGIRYYIRVRGKETYMFMEESHGVTKWFMERK